LGRYEFISLKVANPFKYINCKISQTDKLFGSGAFSLKDILNKLLYLKLSPKA